MTGVYSQRSRNTNRQCHSILFYYPQSLFNVSKEMKYYIHKSIKKCLRHMLVFLKKMGKMSKVFQLVTLVVPFVQNLVNVGRHSVLLTLHCKNSSVEANINV